MPKLIPTLLFVLCLSGRMLAAGELGPEFKVVALHNGVNAVDIDGDGKQDVIVVGYRENGNAHSTEVTTLFIWATGYGDKAPVLQIVPRLPADGDKEEDVDGDQQLTTGGGADAVLEDFRLLVDAAHHKAALVTAEREFGDSYADTRPVTFRFYELKRYTEGKPGEPLIAFKAYKKTVSKKPYQGVEEAFKAELGLPLDGRQPLTRG